MENTNPNKQPPSLSMGFLDKLKRFRPSSRVKHLNNTTNQPIETSASQLLAVPPIATSASQLLAVPPIATSASQLLAAPPIATSASQLLAAPASVPVRPHSSSSATPQRFAIPHSPNSGTSALQTRRTSSLRDLSTVTAGGIVAATPPGSHDSPSSSNVQISSSYSQSKPIPSDNPTSSSTCAVQVLGKTNVQTEALQTKSTLGPGNTESSIVWAEALKIAKDKLGDKNFPLDLTNLTSQSAEENIEAVIDALNILQGDDKKKRLKFNWNGKEVIVVERLGRILKRVEKYSKVVDTAIQTNPQVSALVWAGIWAIMQVCI